jgi:hypothetical protein
MQIDFTQTLKNMSGEDLIHEERPATLRDICLKALLEYPAQAGENVQTPP